MPTPRDFAPGPGWRPPGELVSKSGRDSTADYLNAIAGVAARANNFDLGTPGIHFGHAFHPTPNIQAQSRSFTALMIEDLSPGTWDDPEVSPAYLMLREQKSGPLKASEQIISVVSYSSSVSAASGTTAIGYVDTDGTYVAESGGGGSGGAEIINFEVLAACPGLDASIGNRCPCVQAVITRVLCVSSVRKGDFITVWDIDTCWFNIPLSLLVGRKGTAFLMRVGDDDNGQVNCSGYGAIRPGECFWSVESLCCAEEAYY